MGCRQSAWCAVRPTTTGPAQHRSQALRSSAATEPDWEPDMQIGWPADPARSGDLVRTALVTVRAGQRNSGGQIVVCTCAHHNCRAEHVLSARGPVGGRFVFGWTGSIPGPRGRTTTPIRTPQQLRVQARFILLSHATLDGDHRMSSFLPD